MKINPDSNHNLLAKKRFNLVKKPKNNIYGQAEETEYVDLPPPMFIVSKIKQKPQNFD
jgi:hypothetical protein